MEYFDPRRFLKSEDSYTERKPSGVKDGELRKTMVAFANSAPADRPGVLYVGILDDGSVQGVENIDKLQKRIRGLAERECYPPIQYMAEAITVEGVEILAVSVPRSLKRPHFAGPAYTRVGSESKNASEELLREFIAARSDVGRVLSDHIGATISVRLENKKLGGHVPAAVSWTLA